MTNQNSIFNNFIWRFLERCGAQGVTFIVSVVLARLLNPTVYGIVALMTVFTAILQVFVDSGLANALIQKKDADDLDFSSVFYFNLLLGLLLYGLMYVAAPYIAAIYNLPEITSMLRALCLLIIIAGLKNVQQAYVSRNLLFKRFFYATLGGTICAAVAGLWTAWRGYGAWALVIQYLVNAAVDTLILWISVGWRPKLVFSWRRLKGLLSYGWKLLVSALIDTVYGKLRQLIIGTMYSTADLAFYNKAETFPGLITSNINISIDSVLLPVMSAEQDKLSTVRGITRRAIKTSSYIMWPMMVGLAVCAEPMIRLVLSEKWIPCVPFLQLFCIVFAFYPIHTANLNAIKALGRSDLFLKLEIMKKAVGLVVLLSTMWFGVMAMAYSMLFTSVASQIINSWPNKALLDYSYGQQIKDIAPAMGLSVFMGICVWLVTLLDLNDWVTLCMQIPLGITIYVAGSAILKLESFLYLLNALLTRSKK